MVPFSSLPRKRRPREHVIADLSLNHLERFILEAGHTIQRVVSDYGYDLMVTTFDEAGYIEAGAVYIQLKASESLTAQGNAFPFDLDVRDYNLWLTEESPVLVVLYDASRRKAYWVCVQDFFRRREREPRPGAKTVRVLVPRRQSVTRSGVVAIRTLKGKWAGRILRSTP